MGDQDVHSVPSVFARPILSDQAFNDPTHPSHAAVIDQWRGLLAIFGLKGWKGFDISFIPFSINPPRPGATSHVGNVPLDGLHLTTMLHTSLPNPPSQWDPLRLILCDGVLVGAISPWTLALLLRPPALGEY